MLTCTVESAKLAWLPIVFKDVEKPILDDCFSVPSLFKDPRVGFPWLMCPEPNEETSAVVDWDLFGGSLTWSTTSCFTEGSDGRAVLLCSLFAIPCHETGCCCDVKWLVKGPPWSLLASLAIFWSSCLGTLITLLGWADPSCVDAMPWACRDCLICESWGWDLREVVAPLMGGLAYRWEWKLLELPPCMGNDVGGRCECCGCLLIPCKEFISGLTIFLLVECNWEACPPLPSEEFSISRDFRLLLSAGGKLASICIWTVEAGTGWRGGDLWPFWFWDGGKELRDENARGSGNWWDPRGKSCWWEAWFCKEYWFGLVCWFLAAWAWSCRKFNKQHVTGRIYTLIIPTTYKSWSHHMTILDLALKALYRQRATLKVSEFRKMCNQLTCMWTLLTACLSIWSPTIFLITLKKSSLLTSLAWGNVKYIQEKQRNK